MPVTLNSNPVNVGSYLSTKPQGNGIQRLSVPLGRRLQICQDDLRKACWCFIRTNGGDWFGLNLLEARQAASLANPLQQVILRFFTGTGGRTLLECSYHYPERTPRKVVLEPLSKLFIMSYPDGEPPPKFLHLNLTAHSWMKTGLLTVGGIALALLAAAAWMRKKGMTDN